MALSAWRRRNIRRLDKSTGLLINVSSIYGRLHECLACAQLLLRRDAELLHLPFDGGRRWEGIALILLIHSAEKLHAKERVGAGCGSICVVDCGTASRSKRDFTLMRFGQAEHTRRPEARSKRA